MSTRNGVLSVKFIPFFSGGDCTYWSLKSTKSQISQGGGNVSTFQGGISLPQATPVIQHWVYY